MRGRGPVCPVQRSVREVNMLAITYEHPPCDGSHGRLLVWRLHEVSRRDGTGSEYVGTTYGLSLVRHVAQGPFALLFFLARRVMFWIYKLPVILMFAGESHVLRKKR